MYDLCEFHHTSWILEIPLPSFNSVLQLFPLTLQLSLSRWVSYSGHHSSGGWGFCKWGVGYTLQNFQGKHLPLWCWTQISCPSNTVSLCLFPELKAVSGLNWDVHRTVSSSGHRIFLGLCHWGDGIVRDLMSSQSLPKAGPLEVSVPLVFGDKTKQKLPVLPLCSWR